MPHERTGPDAVQDALAHPIGAPRLRALAKPGQKIAIIASDISRPVPSYEILPAVLDELIAAGCRREDVTVVFALGSHRHHTEEEKRHLAGSAVYDTVCCVDSDPTDCVHMGTTKTARQSTLPALLPKQISASVPETLNFTILPVIPAAQRPSCPVFLHRQPFRLITV